MKSNSFRFFQRFCSKVYFINNIANIVEIKSNQSLFQLPLIWMLCMSLCQQTSNDSPSPTPFEIPTYFMKKVTEFQAKGKSKALIPSTAIKKAFHSPKIPPSGTSIKHEFNILSLSQISTQRTSVKNEPNTLSAADLSHTSYNLSDSEEICKAEEYIQIAHLKPQFAEFTYVFSAFSKNSCQWLCLYH